MPELSEAAFVSELLEVAFVPAGKRGVVLDIAKYDKHAFDGCSSNII